MAGLHGGHGRNGGRQEQGIGVGAAGGGAGNGAPDGEASGGEVSRTAEAVRRLRFRGCWTEAAALLEPAAGVRPDVALHRAETLIEGALYTAEGWDGAEAALRRAEALARSDEQRAAAACARGQLAFAATVLRVRDRADEAHAALGRAAAMLPPGAPRRPVLDHRRGLLAQHLAGQPEAARAAYRRALAGARANADERQTADTLQQLAGLAAREMDLVSARESYRECVRLRERIGHLVGLAPALTGLARVEAEPEAGRLRLEAARLVRALGGVPVWLAEELADAVAADMIAEADTVAVEPPARPVPPPRHSSAAHYSAPA